MALLSAQKESSMPVSAVPSLCAGFRVNAVNQQESILSNCIAHNMKAHGVLWCDTMLWCDALVMVCFGAFGVLWCDSRVLMNMA